MPELPEVETVCRTLRKYIINKKIINCEIYETKCIKNSTINSFKEKIIGETFCDIKRRGKHIIFVLNNYVIISHLRMEGKYFYLPASQNIPMKHILLTFFLDNNFALNYHDTRRFGTFHIFDIANYQNLPPILNIGIEPFDDKLCPDILLSKWKNRKKPIKSLLLEQNLIAGIGNIYADEILYYCKINPLTFGNKLTLNDCKQIIQGAQIILAKAIELGGTTVSSYSSEGVHGKFQNELKVYHQHNKPCMICGTIIEQIKISGRSTHFCPNCQRKK